MNVMVIPGAIRVHLCPKVATASLSAAMRGTGYRDTTPNEDGGELRFIPVRHPLDRMLSAWSYFCDTPDDKEIRAQKPLMAIGYYWRMPFEEFAELCIDRHEDDQHTRRQVSFHGPHTGNALLCPIEKLPETWEAIRIVFPALRPLAHHHQTRRNLPWESYFNPQLLQRAEDVFVDDVALFERACSPAGS